MLLVVLCIYTNMNLSGNIVKLTAQTIGSQPNPAPWLKSAISHLMMIMKLSTYILTIIGNDYDKQSHI